MKSPIPKSALEHHIAFLGKTGSGKTGSAKSGIIEPALAAGERVCVIDPTGAWWGLRLGADGKATGLPIYVFGGDHGDFPLLGNQGEMVAEAIGSTNTPAILDTSQLRSTERMRFFTNFAETILRANQGPLRLVIDEAHLFAPQAGTRGSGAMPDMLHAANNLISLGRSRGLRIVLISQRPAKVHKDSLTQVETLVSMRLTAPQDRAAVREWIADQADLETGKEIIASLPSLKNGEAWVWSPAADFLKRVTFPFPTTYDSSAVQGTGKAKKRLSPIDVEKLQEKFAKVRTEAQENDPVELRKRIGSLTAELRKAKGAAVDPAALKAEYKRGVVDADHRNARIAKEFEQTLTRIQSDVNKAVASMLGTLTSPKAKSGLPTVTTTSVDSPKRAAAPPRPAARVPSPAASGDGSLTNPQRDLLAAIAWWKVMDHDQPSRVQVAAIAGWKPKGSNLRGRLAELSSAGLITYPSPSSVALTEAGFAAAPAPDTSRDLISSIKAVLTNPQLQLFEQLLETGAEPIAREDLAAAVGWEPKGSNLRGRLSELSSLEVIAYPSPSMVALQDWVVA